MKGGNYIMITENKSIFSQDTCDKIQNIVKEIGKKLSNPEMVKKIVDVDDNYIEFEGNKIKSWSELSMADGYPSVCLLLGELSENYPEEEWDIMAHQYMIKIQEAINTHGIYSSSLFGGTAGIGMAALALSKGGERYSNFINQINEFLISHVDQLMEASLKRLSESGAYSRDYDVIQGYSGIGRYILMFKEQPAMVEVLKNILNFFVKMCENRIVEGHDVPGWYISKENLVTERDRSFFPKGNLNCGLSHGIAGPLALMSLALTEGIEVEGQREAVEKILVWLDKNKITDENGIYWGTVVTFEDEIKGINTSKHTRAAWCYGTPGTARAVYLGGCALNDEKYKTLACEAFHSVFKRPESEWNIFSPTFCHGFAGLLHITQLMYEDTKDLRYEEYMNTVLIKIFAQYDEEAPFGFKDLVKKDGDSLKKVDSAGLIEGSVGTALVLHSLIEPVKTMWNSAFLII